MKKVIMILIMLSSTLLLSGCSIGKYEGMSAKEWADEYYDADDKYKKFRSCVEDYDSLSFQEKSKYSGVFYYCE